MEDFILISTALNKLNVTVDPVSGEVRTYGFKFLKEDGTIREIYNARKQVYSPRSGSINPTEKKDERSKGMYNLQRNAMIMLIDNDAPEERKDLTFRNVKKPHIVFFRDYNSKKWIEVRH